MAEASSASSYSTSSFFSNNRMAGLMSGLDTEQLVKAMAANTKNRLNSKQQKLQSLQWKQESYRDVISKVSEFQNKYLTITSSSSIKANAVMNKFKSESSSDKVTASAVSSAVPATYHIKEAKAATKAVISSDSAGTIDRLVLDFSNNKRVTDYTVKITLDGTEKEVTFNSGTSEAKAKANFLEAVNKAFENFKRDDQAFEFKEGTTDLTFNTGAETGITHTYKVGYNSEAVGISNDASNMITRNTELDDISFAKELKAGSNGIYKFSINDVSFQFEKNATISEVINEINKSEAGVFMSFSSVTQSFRLESAATGTSGKIDIDQSEGNLMNALFNTDSTFSDPIYGSNGTLTISTDGENYRTYTSASNDYTFDGTTINIDRLGDFQAKEAADGEEAVEEITVTTTKDTSAIKDTIVKFVEDYNKLIQSLYQTVSTPRPKSKGDYFDPLTDEQKEEMDKDEIEKWEENAKTGLLYQDNYVHTLIADIRSVVSSSVDGFNLYKIGIKSPSLVDKSNAVNDNYGQLIIDESKLEAAIESKGDEIVKFFTDADRGLATKLNNAVDRAIKNSATGNYGYLTRVAGIENTTSEKKNSLYTQINSLQKIIEDLQTKYENEMERYWKKFTALETYMSQMQSQSSIFDSGY